MIRPIIKWVLRAFFTLLILIAIIILVRAFGARRMADLDIWHSVNLESEFRVARDGDQITFDTYRKIEARLFEELDQKIVRRVPADAEFRINRYRPDGLNNPATFPRNWNRSYELIPPAIKGGALLLHGLTDSPYSLRKVARVLAAEGVYVLGLRLPGHGTIPAGIRSATRDDWLAAVRIGVRQVMLRKGAGTPFFIVGYSNGAALALKYSLEAVRKSGLAAPDQLILLSPAVAVTPFGAFADWHKTVSYIPFFRKFRWQNIDPEYDPFKYNSFPKNAGLQTYQLTTAVQKQMGTLRNANRLSSFPPVIAFQSLVDDTVRTDAIVDYVFNKLDNPQNELVLFDINRQADTRAFLKSDHLDLLGRLAGRDDLTYRLTVISNLTADSRAVVARIKAARSGEIQTIAIGLHWPAGIFSLSHVAIPFPPDDAIYGRRLPQPGKFGINLGSIEPRGERGLLRTSFEQLMRLRYNPFFPYVEQRIIETVRKQIEESGEKNS